MKILMFGRGVISSTYGWALKNAGHTVHFYVRPGRSTQYGGQLQMQLHDMRQGFFSKITDEKWDIELHEEIEPDHDYDLIFLSVQHYHFAKAAETLASFVGNATVLIFNNFWDEPQEAASKLPADQLVWGFPAAGGGIEGSKLRGILIKSVTIGRFDQPATTREIALRDMFEKSGFSVKEESDFRAWLFIHFAQNAAMQSELLHPKHRVKPVLSFNTFYNITLNARELVPLLAVRGVNIKQHSSAILFRLPVVLSSLILWSIFKFVTPVRNILEWHNNPEEGIRTSIDILEDAKKRGISLPRLESKQIDTPFEVS